MFNAESLESNYKNYDSQCESPNQFEHNVGNLQSPASAEPSAFGGGLNPQSRSPIRPKAGPAAQDVGDHPSDWNRTNVSAGHSRTRLRFKLAAYLADGALYIIF